MNISDIYHGNLAWLPERTIFLCKHGSHAYGLNIATSDTDYKGVAVPPKEYMYGFLNRFEQAESKNPDFVVYDLRKFMLLASDCNPSIIEVLWAEPEICTVAGAALVESRDKFLSKKAKHTFSGYAKAQLKRINTHYRWLKNPPKTPPTRSDLGLPERTVIPTDQLKAAQAAVEKKLLQWNIDILDGVSPDVRIAIQNKMSEILADIQVHEDDKFRLAARSIGYDDNFIRLLDLERQYESKKREWDNYQNWKTTRNPQRAVLEEQFGFDTKHAMHLVRLIRMCREILEQGKVIVNRAGVDREELLSIRAGAWSYDKLVEWADKEDAALDKSYSESKLPNQPNRVELDKLCITLMEQHNGT